MSPKSIEMTKADNKGTLGTARLVMSDMLVLEQVDDEGAVISHKETGKRIRVSHSLYRVITKFRSPATVEHALGNSNAELVRACIQQLIDLDFLRCLESPHYSQSRQKLVRPSVHTLFQSPRWLPGAPAPDVTVVGVPYDAGDAIAGARDAPDAIRQRSSHLPYSLDFMSQKPTGWFDVEARERYLEGVTLADWGNVWPIRGDSPEAFFERIEAASSVIWNAGSFPLFLGGDHSISFPVIKGLGDEKLTVLWFDAHTDFGQLSNDAGPSHKNVLRAIAALPNVHRVCILGHRGYTIADKSELWPKTYSKLQIYTAQRLKSDTSSLIPDMVGDGTHCYVSIDINVLDPIYAPAIASPIPGGLAPNQLKELLRGIGKRARIAGMDLTEMNPAMERGILTATQAMELLIVGVGTAMWNRPRVALPGESCSRASSAQDGREAGVSVVT